MTMNASAYNGINELKDNNRYLVRYNRDVARMLAGSRGTKNLGRVVDFGSGIGTITQAVSDLGHEGTFYCIEPDCNLWSHHPSWATCIDKLDNSLTRSIDLVFSSNVLEHIDDDIGILNDIREVLRQDGLLVLYLPAMPVLWTRMDTKVGHFRRYTKKEICLKVKAAGFRILDVKYIDSIGAISTFFFKVVEAARFNSEYKRPSPSILRFYDRFIWPISKLIDPIIQHCFGKNLVIYVAVQD